MQFLKICYRSSLCPRFSIGPHWIVGITSDWIVGISSDWNFGIKSEKKRKTDVVACIRSQTYYDRGLAHSCRASGIANRETSRQGQNDYSFQQNVYQARKMRNQQKNRKSSVISAACIFVAETGKQSAMFATCSLNYRSAAGCYKAFGWQFLSLCQYWAGGKPHQVRA